MNFQEVVQKKSVYSKMFGYTSTEMQLGISTETSQSF